MLIDLIKKLIANIKESKHYLNRINYLISMVDGLQE